MTQVTDVALTATTEVADVPPKVTAVVPVRFVPVIVTAVLPATGPLVGLTVVIVGAAAYVYPAVFVTDPPGAVRTTSTTPAVFAGVTQVTDVALTATTEVADVPPKVTADVPVRFVPVIVTAVLPDTGPLAGLTVVIVGAAA